MNTQDKSNDVDLEIAAISAVHAALKLLDRDAQKRVVGYVAAKLGIEGTRSANLTERMPDPVESSPPADAPTQVTQTEGDDSLDGISPVARKWMRRNGLTAPALSEVFSVGEDEVDLIAKSVPGKSKKTKTHSVILLKGVAAYLGSGAARITHQQIKEVSLHYDAYDSPNFAAYLKDFASEVSGTKEAGYTLTARGLAAATELVKQMVQAEK